MNKIKILIKIVAFTIYFLLLAAVTGKLFFEDRWNGMVAYVANIFSQEAPKTLVIGYSESFISLSPLANDTGSRSRLLHMYEGLVKMSPDLNVEPAIAVSYGSVDDLTWEFRLRPDVYFHNGALLTIDDVIDSLIAAKNEEFAKIQKIDEQTFRIITSEPDPLLLSKLSLTYIFKKNGEEFVGTGPYFLAKNDSGSLTLQTFQKYWARHPVFETVILKAFSSKKEKINALSNETVDIIANVPADSARDFNFNGFSLKTLPSLETNFLIFNFEKAFRDRNLREAILLSLNVPDLLSGTFGFAAEINQFVGNGIFGFDPQIKTRNTDIEKAAELIRLGSPEAEITLNLPIGLELFGTKIKNQLEKIAVAVNLELLKQDELSRRIADKKSDFFFFGWRSELGDSYDLLSSVFHSSAPGLGQFNGGNYSNAEVDRLIESSQKEMNQKKRLDYLRNAMRIITIDDIAGIPLFSPELLYGVSKRIDWHPRVDGYILAQEVKMW